MNLYIKKVTEQNRVAVLALSVAVAQKGFIETTAQCLQEAADDPRFVPVGLYVEDELVGFAMYGKFTEGQQSRVWLDRLLIDEAYQGQGYGRAFLQELIAHIGEVYQTDRIYLSVYPNNRHAIQLYERYGFRFTGEVDCNGERLMVKDVRDHDNECN